jgi:cysteine desulfurase / selenocysteine lyase
MEYNTAVEDLIDRYKMANSGLDIKKIRQDFPALKQKIHGKPLVFLDTAASAQKPQSVIDLVTQSYTNNYANVHRGVYTLSDQATSNYEATRQCIADFIGAKSADEIVFTKGTTESINLVAQSLSQFYFQEGDEVILTEMEHHANIVPWQMLVQRCGIIIKVVPIFDDGCLDMDAYYALLSEKTKLVAVTQCSNVLGTINPVKEMTQAAHKVGALVLIDGAQSVVHQEINVQDLDCDFFVFSSHKLYGPTGVGVLYGKYEWLDKMPPYQGGGDMIKTVSFSGSEYADAPHKFEAGTPDIVAVSAFKAAVKYVQDIGLKNIEAYEHQLLEYATEKLSAVKGLKILGTAKNKAAVITFIIEGLHANDLGTLMDLSGVAVRTGQHCCHPLMDHYGVSAAVRASFALYNTYEEIDALVASIEKARKMLG